MQDTLIAHASELRLGINLKDPSLVGHIANDSTYLNRLGRNWMCDNYCPYKHQCLRMRAEEVAAIKPLIQISGRVFGLAG